MPLWDVYCVIGFAELVLGNTAPYINSRKNLIPQTARVRQASSAVIGTKPLGKETRWKRL